MAWIEIEKQALENMLERFAIELGRSPAKYELYEQFRPRLMAIRRHTNIGWGYGDFVSETIDDLEKTFSREGRTG